MTLRYGSFQAVPGGGSTSAVNSVNGKTGDVLLSSDDLNAQKKTSALPVGTADINDEVAFQQGGVSLRTAIENLPTSLATRQALLGKLDASQKGTANGVAELDASGKLPVNRLPDAALGGLAYQGGWNAVTNTPALTTPATRGYYWVVTTAGSTNIGGVTDWQVGDWVISNGTAWQKIDQTDVVTSVNGKQGAVVLNAADVGAQPVDATLTALAGLVAAANKLAYFTGDDQMALADFTAFARTLLSSVDAAAARTVLGAQASDATLTALAGVTTAADKLPYFTGADAAAVATLTTFARTLLDDADASTMRSTLGLVKQTSATDTTAGAVLSVGSFGLGTAGYGFSADLSEDRQYSHFSSSTSAATDVPGNNTMDWGFSPLIHAFRAGGDGTGQIGQLIFGIDRANKGRLASRARNVGTWSSWKIFHDNESLPYETGTFTPTVFGATVAGVATYTIQLGKYTRIGNRVFFMIYVSWTAASGTGDLRIGGFPFTSAGSSPEQFSIIPENLTFSGQLVAGMGSGTNYATPMTVASGVNWAPVSMDAAAGIRLSGSYQIL